MNEIAIAEKDKNYLQTLKDSVYPGAKDDSIKMVLAYCKAANLDPLMKPVHIVPISGKDVIMPGIGLYRIQAERSGCYAGVTEPEYGPTINETLGKITISYPEWCKITVKKLIQGQIFEFTAKEFWKENYASQGATAAPNMIWWKRPFGQLAKVAESQALRKAFPSLITHQATAEEMEGKVSYNATVLPKTYENIGDNIKEKLKSKEVKIIDNLVTDETLDILLQTILDNNVTEETLNKWCEKAGVSDSSDFTEEQAQAIINKFKKE